MPNQSREHPGGREPGAHTPAAEPPTVRDLEEFEVGFLIGVLVAGGHFGGDGRQPHITVRMHTDHVSLFEWLESHFPNGRLYGPYHHGGRHYYQWMARGEFLRDELFPLLDARLTPELDAPAFERFQAMKARYRSHFAA